MDKIKELSKILRLYGKDIKPEDLLLRKIEDLAKHILNAGYSRHKPGKVLEPLDVEINGKN